MCDAGDLVDVGGAIATGGASIAYKKITGNDVPGAQVLKKLVGADGVEVPKLPDLPGAPPPPPDPSDMIVRRAMAAERLRAARASGVGASFLTGPRGLSGGAPIAAPSATGY